MKDNNIFYEFIGNTQEKYFEIDGELKLAPKIYLKLIINGIIIINANTMEVTKLIKDGIPDASIEIKDLMGDSNHYEAIIKSAQCIFVNRSTQTVYNH